MGVMFDVFTSGAVMEAGLIATKEADSKTLVDALSNLKDEKNMVCSAYDVEINRLEVELTSRGLRQLEDRNIKFTTFKGDKASVTIGMARSLKILSVDNLKKAITDRWHGEIKTKEPDHSVAADFSRALVSLYMDDYVSEMSLADILAKGLTFGDKGVTFTKDNLNLLLKKLKGDYEKDKKLFEGILGVTLESEIDEELYFIAKIKNWERIRKYFTQDEAIKVKLGIKTGIFVQETARLTMRQ